MAGLVPATPIIWHGRASSIGVAGTSPAMTSEDVGSIQAANLSPHGRASAAHFSLRCTLSFFARSSTAARLDADWHRRIIAFAMPHPAPRKGHHDESQSLRRNGIHGCCHDRRLCLPHHREPRRRRDAAPRRQGGFLDRRGIGRNSDQGASRQQRHHRRGLYRCQGRIFVPDLVGPDARFLFGRRRAAGFRACGKARRRHRDGKPAQDRLHAEIEARRL